VFPRHSFGPFPQPGRPVLKLGSPLSAPYLSGTASGHFLRPADGAALLFRTPSPKRVWVPFKNNRTFAVLSVATKRSWLDKQTGERVSRTQWHRVVAWGKLGELAKTLAKGSRVQVEGELRSRTYTGKDNIRRRVSEVHLGSIRKLGRAERPAPPAAKTAPPSEA
jgi:single-strand DNA-binding protein